MQKPLVALLLATLTACSSSMSDPEPGGPTADQACTDLSNLYCAKIDGCSSLFTQISFADVAACKATFKSQCLLDLAAPSTGATPQTQADCTAAAGSLSCTDLFANNVPSQCRAVSGKLSDGQACGDDSQCASKYCSTGDSAACGKCFPAPTAGASCSTQKCGPGLDCHKDSADPTGKTRTCVKLGNVGDACSDVQPCIQNLSCTDGKCGAAATKEGDACSFTGKGAPQCDLTAGLICNPATSKCLLVKLAGPGSACGYDATAGTFTACSNEGVCKKAKPADPTGTCVAAVAIGQACNDDETVGPKCLAPGKCVAGTCVTPDPSTCK